MGYTKDDVEWHGEYMRPNRPAVNVKVYKFPSVEDVKGLWPDCDDNTAENALQFALEQAQQIFWEDVTDCVEDIFGKGVTVRQEGRSGGWLVVEGLPRFEKWNAVDLAKWRKFENSIKREIEDRSRLENVLEAIESNEWYKAGAERYNFYDKKEGGHGCIADDKEAAVKAGFGHLLK